MNFALETHGFRFNITTDILIFKRHLTDSSAIKGPVGRSGAFKIYIQLTGWLERRLVVGMENFQQPGYGGVTETWNVIQHEVSARTLFIEKTGSQGSYMTPF